MRTQAFIVKSTYRPREYVRQSEAIASRGIIAEVISLGLGERGGRPIHEHVTRDV